MTTIPMRVAMQDGKPLCPCCGDTMVEVKPGRWACPFWAQIDKIIDQDLGAYPKINSGMGPSFSG